MQATRKGGSGHGPGCRPLPAVCLWMRHGLFWDSAFSSRKRRGNSTHLDISSGEWNETVRTMTTAQSWGTETNHSQPTVHTHKDS